MSLARRLRPDSVWQRFSTPKHDGRTKRFRATFETLEDRHLLATVADWTIRGVGGGGALFGPAIDPHNPDHMLISSDMSQLFQTSNAGAAWNMFSHAEIRGGEETQVKFTSNPNIAYAIDATPLPFDATSPAKSTDGGDTWVRLTADPTSGETYNLNVDYQNPERLVVGSWDTLYLSNDGGQSFQQVFQVVDNDAGLLVGGVVFDGSSIYVGTNHGLLASNNGGQTFSVANWTGIPSDERILSLSGASEGGTTRLYVVTKHEDLIWNGIQPTDTFGYRSVYRTDVGTSQWSEAISGIAADEQPFFVVAPTDDIDTVYVAGGNETFPSVYKSVDGAATWTDVFLTEGNVNIETSWQGHQGDVDWWWGGTAMGFAIDVTNPDRAIITDLGFAHMTTDGGQSWFNLNVHPDDRNPVGQATPKGASYRGTGLENSAAWDVTWTSPDGIIASQTDFSGTISEDGGRSWSFDYTGHDQNTMYRAVKNATSGITYAATSDIHNVYQVTHVSDTILDPGVGKVLFSNDDGHQWETLHDFGNLVAWVELDPANPNRLYASVVHSTEGGIYVSDDIQNGAASTWTRLAAPPRTEGHPFNIRLLDDGSLVASYSARMNAAGAFTTSSGVFMSTDGGQSWLDRTDTDMRFWTKDIVVDPHDSTQNTWYAGIWSGWGGPPNDLGGLFKTTDRGQTWERLTTKHRISSATISPLDPNEMYFTTETEGLWYTDNLNSADPTFELVESYLFGTPERVFYNPHDQAEVWVASFGGAYHVGRTDAPDGDFNDDGAYTTFDIDALTHDIANSTHNTAYDLNGDGQVDLADRDAWLSEAATAIGYSSPIKLGDANLDGLVDGLDFLAWNAHKFTPSTAWSEGNFNADLVVDGQDFLLWNSNKFTASVAVNDQAITELAQADEDAEEEEVGVLGTLGWTPVKMCLQLE